MLLKLTKFPVIHFILIIFLFLGEKIVYAGTLEGHNLYKNPIDSVLSTKDTLKISKKEDGALNSKVKYTAKDSIRFDVISKKVYLYGNASIHYEAIDLKAGFITIDWNDNTVYAEPLPDSTGKLTGKPVFTDDNGSFNAQSMKYNFTTKKGKISSVITKEGEGYIHGEVVKKYKNNDFFIKNGKYTTCDLDTPHYYIASGKLKVMPNDKVITGPAYLIIEKIPTPFAIPFGYFPNKKGQSSGIIIPTYGESTYLGFFLKNGGYYLGISDHLDLALKADIYSKGSWGGGASSNYAKRYKYRGAFSFNYNFIKNGEPELPGYQINKDFFINWSHSQDPKAHPNSLFTANVNAGSNTFYTHSLSNTNNYLTNTFQSAISYSKTWPGKPFNLSLSARHNQNTLNKQISITLPEATFNVNRINFFKSKIQSPEQKWYEKIGASYVINARNSIQATDSTLFKETFRQFQNGLRQSMPISTSFKLLKFFSLSPSVNFNSSSYLQSIRKHWDNQRGGVVIDTVKKFSTSLDYSVNASLFTRIYGMFQFKKGNLIAIRHVISPSVQFSYHPDFSKPSFGYYRYVRTNLKGDSAKYFIYEGSIFGGPPTGKAGIVSFSLDNLLDLKLKNKKDTISGTKKIKIFENLSFNSSYNMAADSLKWSNITMNGRTTLFNKVYLNFSGTFDPYTTDQAGNKINKFEIKEHKRLARLTDAGLSFSFNLNPSAGIPKQSNKGSEQELKQINMNPDAYIDFNIPWTLNMNYNILYTKPNYQKSIISQTLSFSGDVSLTPKWKIGFNSGYDFINKDFSYSSINIYRDLHCWEMHFNWIPFGFRQSYNFQINVKSSMLQDLKLVRRRDWSENR